MSDPSPGAAARQILEATDGECRPALVARADPPAGVAAEELGEGDEVAPVGIVAEARVVPLAGAAAVGIRDEEAREPAVELLRDLTETHEAPRAGGTLDAQVVAVEVVVALERLGEQVVQREPHRAAPVGVAPEETGVRLGGRVVDLVLMPVHRENDRALA